MVKQQLTPLQILSLLWCLPCGDSFISSWDEISLVWSIFIKVIRKNTAFEKKASSLSTTKTARGEIKGLDTPHPTLENSFLDSSWSKIIENIGIGQNHIKNT